MSTLIDGRINETNYRDRERLARLKYRWYKGQKLIKKQKKYIHDVKSISPKPIHTTFE